MRTKAAVSAAICLFAVAACGEQEQPAGISGLFDDLPGAMANCKAPADFLEAPHHCDDVVTPTGEVCSYCLHEASEDGALHIVYEDESACGALAGCGGPAPRPSDVAVRVTLPGAD